MKTTIKNLKSIISEVLAFADLDNDLATNKNKKYVYHDGESLKMNKKPGYNDFVSSPVAHLVSPDITGKKYKEITDGMVITDLGERKQSEERDHTDNGMIYTDLEYRLVGFPDEPGLSGWLCWIAYDEKRDEGFKPL